MKRFIKSSSSQVVTLYHGGQLRDNCKFYPVISMPDLGLHVGSLAQAESHNSSFIFSVECELKNIVKVSDQGDWNTPQAVTAILKAKGLNYSLQDVIQLQRQSINTTSWQEKSEFYNTLLVENGISVIEYENMEDTVRDTCYCIVDSDCIKSIDPYLTHTGSNAILKGKAKDWIDRLPEWVPDYITYFNVSPAVTGNGYNYELAIHPLPDDPDQHVKQFRTRKINELRQMLDRYKSTYEADLAYDHQWLTENRFHLA